MGDGIEALKGLSKAQTLCSVALKPSQNSMVVKDRETVSSSSSIVESKPQEETVAFMTSPNSQLMKELRTGHKTLKSTIYQT